MITSVFIACAGILMVAGILAGMFVGIARIENRFKSSPFLSDFLSIALLISSMAASVSIGFACLYFIIGALK